jgi:hypothetical protein
MAHLHLDDAGGVGFDLSATLDQLLDIGKVNRLHGIATACILDAVSFIKGIGTTP